jgi:hypothetical protein
MEKFAFKEEWFGSAANLKPFLFNRNHLAAGVFRQD